MSPTDQQALDLIADLQREGKLPNQLTRQQLAAILSSLRKYAANVGIAITQNQLDQVREAMKKATESLTNPQQVEGATTGFNPATARNSIAEVLQKLSIPGLLQSNNIDFGLSVARQVVLGAASYVKDGLDQGVVDEYPAWELLRVYEREVPRGFRKGRKGVLIAEPDQDWPSRWEAAGGPVTGDNRMIALKSDDVWKNIGDGVGGYDDTLGNPFPPFAFNSGFDVQNVGRQEAINLGLMDASDAVKAPRFDLWKLFADI